MMHKLKVTLFITDYCLSAWTDSKKVPYILTKNGQGLKKYDIAQRQTDAGSLLFTAYQKSQNRYHTW